jgi:diguanylate cyclase (GGDEF)-like protein/PAS domain S-box-containing protein
VVRFYLLLGCAWILVSDGLVFLRAGEGRLAALISIGKGLFFVGVTALAVFLYMTRWARASQSEAEALRRRLSQLSKYANDIVLLFDGAGKIVEANDRAVDAYGYPADTLLSFTLDQIRTSDDLWRNDWETVVNRGDVRFESVHRRADGSTFPVEVSSRRIDIKGQYLIQSIIRDISERRAAEARIIGLKDVYAALSQTNQTIVRVNDRDELFQKICDIAIEFGHFQLAWIGIVDEGTKNVIPAAMAGTELAYLDGLHVSADPQSELSTGPTGLSVVTGARVVANDLQATLLGKPWRIRWEQFDMRASAGFPLFSQGRAIGALTLYSRRAGFFTEDLVSLLDEMAMDISFALDRLEADHERRRLGEEVIASNARVQGIIEGTQDLILAVDKNLRITLCNRTHQGFLHNSDSDARHVGLRIDEWLSGYHAERDILVTHLSRALLGEHHVENWQSSSASDPVYFESYFAPLRNPAGEMIGAFHIGRNVSEHKRMEAELRKLTTAVEQSPVTILITDTSGTIQYVNPAFTATTGYSAIEALGQTPRFLRSGETTKDEYRSLWKTISSGQPWFGLFHNRRKNGTLFWEEAVIAPVRNESGSITQYIALKQDITSRVEAEERASFLTYHDALTRLPNRSLGKHYMEASIAEAGRSSRVAALFSINVDNFKRINDSLGYRIGDLLIQAIAARLQACLRTADVLMRTSGDDFLIVLAPVYGRVEIEHLATAILDQAASSFFAVEGFELSVTLSIGIAVYPDDGQEFDQLHKQADMAMTAAKKSGRNAYRFYSQKLEEDAAEYLLILNGLRKAIDRRELFVQYQPLFSLADGRIAGAEALVRWRHPDLGIISPARFIPIAEDSGLIVEIGEWVLQTACRQAACWQQLGFGRLVVSVNLSAVQFKRGGLPEMVRKALVDANLEPSCLKLELTESTLIENDSRVRTILQELKQIGVSLSLDDFGTGYASFAYLRNLDLDELKIDQSFIREISTKKGDKLIVKSIVDLARGFGLRTVAEGIQDVAALELVRASGCDYGQGFFLARPMSDSDICDAIRRFSANS